MKLFAVFLGGKAKGASIEMHDLVFVAGRALKDTIPQLRKLWFGDKSSVHIDSYAPLTHVDGYEIELVKGAPRGGPKLYFVNIGSYTKNRFGENHHYFFIVAKNGLEARARAKAAVKTLGEDVPHTDNLFEIDKIAPVKPASGLALVLTKRGRAKPVRITNTYLPIGRH
ncbi:MAG TPA: DUF1543 domain-containing protein [Bdellovibrionales bacterium]|nr:DUF1543 domain-containing protein [Bdellovibrionales bacterium]